MFYTFNQNNSGGSFDFNEKSGITHFVIVEAESEEGAIEKAEQIGIYFDGVEQDIDCECCGDRWDFPYDSHAHPGVYGKDVRTEEGREFMIRWMEKGKEVCIHYKDGRKEWV